MIRVRCVSICPVVRFTAVGQTATAQVRTDWHIWHTRQKSNAFGKEPTRDNSCEPRRILTTLSMRKTFETKDETELHDADGISLGVSCAMSGATFLVKICVDARMSDPFMSADEAAALELTSMPQRVVGTTVTCPPKSHIEGRRVLHA